MAKQFKDFTFMNKKFTSVLPDYISSSLDIEEEKNLALERDMEIGGTNRYRTEANYFYDKWTANLHFDLFITKNICKYENQNDLKITQDEIRKIARWLTSPHLPNWIKFEYSPENNSNVKNYYGWFKNITPWVVGGDVYGLTLSFECTTPFGYTDIIENEITVSTYSNMIIQNESDDLFDYCYPTIEIIPKTNGQIYMCNLTDCKVLDTGTLSLEGSHIDNLLDNLEEYGMLHGYDVEYGLDPEDDFDIVPICNNTAIQFYYIDKYDNRTKCTAFYLPDTLNYQIIEGGFMYMTVYKDLNIYMDCKNLTINDELGRMVTYDKLGILDVDSVYWMRLINGENTLLCFGNCTFKVKHIENRKVGE